LDIYSEEFLALRSTHKSQDQPLLALRDCLLSIFIAVSSMCGLLTHLTEATGEALHMFVVVLSNKIKTDLIIYRNRVVAG
jgi:hypothetical protein